MKVSLRRYFEKQLKTRDKALKLQAREYERRLEALNHAHEQNVVRNAEFVSNDKFIAFLKEFAAYKEASTADKLLHQGMAAATARNIRVVVSVFGFILTTVMILNFVLSAVAAIRSFFVH